MRGVEFHRYVDVSYSSLSYLGPAQWEKRHPQATPLDMTETYLL
jgi:hypothetical protein